jgi:hypothetical protein
VRERLKRNCKAAHRPNRERSESPHMIQELFDSHRCRTRRCAVPPRNQKLQSSSVWSCGHQWKRPRRWAAARNSDRVATDAAAIYMKRKNANKKMLRTAKKTGEEQERDRGSRATHMQPGQHRICEHRREAMEAGAS